MKLFNASSYLRPLRRSCPSAVRFRSQRAVWARTSVQWSTASGHASEAMKRHAQSDSEHAPPTVPASCKPEAHHLIRMLLRARQIIPLPINSTPLLIRRACFASRMTPQSLQLVERKQHESSRRFRLSTPRPYHFGSGGKHESGLRCAVSGLQNRELGNCFVYSAIESMPYQRFDLFIIDKRPVVAWLLTSSSDRNNNPNAGRRTGLFQLDGVDANIAPRALNAAT